MKFIKAYAMSFIFAWTSTGFAAGTESATAAKTTSPSAPSITDSSSNASKDNKMGQALNMVTGAVNFGVGAYYASECGPHNGMACAMSAMFFLMGAQNMMQASAQGKSGGQASGAVYATDIGLGGSGYDPGIAERMSADPELKAGTDWAASVSQGKAGFTYDPKTNTVTTAKGTKIKGSDLGNSSALAAAGVPKAAIDLMNSSQVDALAKAQQKIDKLGLNKLNTNVVAGEESSGGGGSGGSGSSGAGGDAAGYGVAGAGAHGAGLGIDRDPAQIAGMQKNYNGEPIGVSGDSIFKMMTRRYKVKESQSTFLDESDVLMQK